MSERSGLSRRDFLKGTAATALGVALNRGAANAEARVEGNAVTVISGRRGEPYELAGKRLVFTNWHYIRPGSFGWYNDKGESVTVRGSEGPWGAHFARRDLPSGIRLIVQPAQRVGPIVKDDKTFSITTVIQEGTVYRAWGGRSSFESADGMNWELAGPGVGQDPQNPRNTMFGFEVANGTVFRDPSAPDDERYKWVAEHSISREEFEAFKKRRPDGWDQRAWRPDVGSGVYFAVRGAVSPDGFRWRVIPEPLVVEHSDTQVTCYYDELLRKYVMYTRNYPLGLRSERDADKFRAWWDAGRRSIGRTESGDFSNFPLSEVILEPGPDMLPSDLIYTNCKTTIPHAPDHHMMFPTIWHAAADDTTSVAVASSHNGKLWHWLPGSSVFETPSFGEWDGGCVFAHPNLVELPNGDWVLPYTGYIFPHKYPRGQWEFRPGYLVWPKGRLLGIEAQQLGEFATVALMPPGRKLKVNAVVRRAGGILVEVAGLDSGPIAGRTFAEANPVAGDRHWETITWKSGEDLGHSDGQAIILRFRLDGARLFGLEFE